MSVIILRLAPATDLPSPSIVSSGELASSEAYEGCLVQVVNAVCTTLTPIMVKHFSTMGSGEVKTNDYMYLPETGWVLDGNVLHNGVHSLHVRGI